MKKTVSTLLFLAIQVIAFACPVCERNKPKYLRGITHGSGPDSKWDYVIVITMGIIAVLTLLYSIKYFVKPEENNESHIKYSFLNEQ